MLASTGATDVNLAVSGTVYKVAPTAHVTGFATGVVTTANIPLAWTAASPAPDGYLIKVSSSTIANPVDGTDSPDDLSLSDGVAQVKVTPGSSTAYSSFTGFVAGTTYTFAIFPYNNNGSQIRFLISSAPSLQAVLALAAPTSVALSSATISSFSASWTAVASAVSYQLDVASDNLFTSMVTGYNALSVSGTNQAVTGLAPNSTYFVRARAVNGTGSVSADSPTNSVTTLHLPPPVTGSPTGVSDSGFTLNWSAVTGATGYRADVYSGVWATDLIISEYLEGTSNNKYVEIYNGTGRTVELSDYELRLYGNGSATPTGTQLLSALSGGPITLAHGACLVLKNSNAALALPAGVTAYSSSTINFNGDDALAIWKKSTAALVDVFGTIGSDPGNSWTSGSFNTLDKTLTRNAAVTAGITVSPTTAFDALPTEWTQSNVDTATGLGSHTMNTTGVFLAGYENVDAGSGSSLAIAGASPGTTYNYRIRATSPTSTSGSSTIQSATTLKADPVITAWPNASQINYGQALSAATFSDGVSTPAGTFAFASPATVPNKTGISSYPVVFTPTDTASYNTATNDVSIMVNSVAQPVYGVTDSQNFEGFTTADLLESANSWSTDDDYVDPGDTYANGFRPDADGGIAASIGGWIIGNPVYRMKYQFDSGTSDRLVFTWKQNIESSADPALPAPDRFGWQFKSGTNVLFSLKMAQFVDSNGNGTWDPATNSIPAEPLAVAANDQPGGYTDTNGVSLYMTNKVVVVGYDSNGNQLTTAELPNFAVLDRDAWYEFRVIVDLHSHLWFAQLKSGANYVNLTGVSGAPLPNSITSVDEMVALWELNDTTVTGGIEPEPYDDTYEMGGSNQMLFDELAITGSKIVELSLATSDKTYNGNPQGATVGESVSGGSVVTYNGSSTVPTDYGYVAVSLSTVSPYFGVVATNAATLYETPATLTGSYWINRKPVTITGLSANNKAYNGNFVAVLSGTPALNGVVAGDVANLAGTPNVQFAQKDVGTNIAVSINGGWTLDGADAANYQLQLPTFTADIGKATLTLTAQNKTRQYGQTNPPLTFTYSGFVGRMSGGVEDASDLDAVPTISTLADQNSNVGNYDITFLGGSDDNYDFNFVPASLSVTAAPLPAVTFTALSGLTYDGNPQDFTAEASGVPGMTFNYLFTGTTFGGTAYSNATAPVNAGTYSLVVTSTDTNYSGSATNSFTIAKANQTINIAALTETKTYGDFPYNLMASTDSLLTLSYTSSDTGVATVDSNGDVVIAGAGLASVTVSQAGNANYEPALDVIYSLTVNKANQIISGISPSEIKTFGDPSYSLGGSSDSSLPLSYASSDANVATVDATGEVTIVGAGVVTITVSQIGDGNYEPATDVTHGLTVNKAAQAISGVAATAEPKTYGDPSYNLGASTDSLLGLTYVSDNPAVATVDATGEVTIVGAGVATITVSQGGDGNYEPAMDMTHVLTVNKATQTISGVAATETKTYGDLPYNLFASTDSSLPLDYYSDNPNVATVDANGEVTIVGAGVATITVSQMGGDNHFPADVTHVLTVNKAAQTISGVAATETKTYGDSSYNLGASTSSSLLLTYTSDTPTVATVDAAGEVTIVGAGVVTITVSQSGGDNYDQATDVTQTLTVNQAVQTISVAPSEIKTYGDPSYSLGASTDSSLPLSYTSSNTNVATVDANGEVTIVGAGAAIITVSQIGDSNYLSADVDHVLTVNQAVQTISGAAATETKTYGDLPYNLGASTDSLLGLTYVSDNTAVATVDASGEVTILGAGVAVITVSQIGDTNYAPAVDVTQTLTVAKANPVIVSAPTASGINLGQALSASTLSGGSVNGVDGNSLAGGFAFTDATEVPGATGTYSASVTFTPTDGDNYNPVTTNVDVTVNTATTPAEDYLASFGLTGANAALTADPDGDGLNNAQEFAFGAVPNVAGSLPITTSNTGGSLKMVFLGRTNGITYNVLSYTNLRVAAVSTNAPTASATQPTNLPAGYKQYEATVDSSTGTRKFLKVDAVIP